MKGEPEGLGSLRYSLARHQRSALFHSERGPKAGRTIKGKLRGFHLPWEGRGWIPDV